MLVLPSSTAHPGDTEPVGTQGITCTDLMDPRSPSIPMAQSQPSAQALFLHPTSQRSKNTWIRPLLQTPVQGEQGKKRV